MKKSTKILTVLLAVCLLFGISSAFATSAAETNVLSVTNHSANVTDDCTSGPEGTDYGLASTGNSLYFGYENSVKSQYIQGTHVKDSTGENTYIRIHYMQGSADTPDPDQKYNHREASTRWRAYTSYNAAADLKNYKYMTLDFDFAADAYVYSFTLNGVKQYKTAASDEEFKKYLGTVTADPNKINEFYEEALATKDLAFPADETLRFNAVFQSSMTDNASGQALSASSSSAHWKQVHADPIFIFKLDDGWYVGKTRDDTEGAVRLSNEAGVFDHITMVFELLDGGLTVRQHIYVNGNYMATLKDKAMDGDSKKYNTFYHLNIPFYQKVAIGTLSDKFYDKYSFAFDNVALNYYDASDVETPGGLGEFMASGDYTTESIMDCTNVVYNGDFIAPNAPVRAIITHNDGSEMVCYTKNSVHRNIRNGDFVTMYQSVDNYSPSPDEIREVTFISQKETTLTLSKEAKEYFKVQHTNDRYTVRFGGENDMSIKWFDAAGEGRTVVKEQKLFPLQKPANNLVIGGEIEYAEGKQPSIGLLNSWLWDVDCDGVGDRPASEILDRTFTMKEINEELREEGIYEIHLIPDYIKVDVYYTVTTDSEKNELYVPDNNFAKFTDPSTLANTISKLEKGKTYYVTLYADVELGSRTMLLPKNVVLDFDVNGCKLGQSAESGSAIFTLSEGATLNLYSSKAGAEVYQNGDDLTGSAIISADNVDAASINLGKVTEDDPTGDNLTVYGASVVYLKGAESKSSNSNKIDVNVNGGNYYGTVAANGALFLVSEMDMVFNISNADMITANGEAIFSVVPAYATSSVIEVTNSNMLAGEVTDDGYVVGSFINEWSSNSKAYIKSSVVFGFENQLNVTLGADNKLNAKVSTDIAYDGETIPVFSSNNATVVSFELNVPGYDETITADVEITLLTYAKNAIADSVKAVSWLDPEGNVYSTTYWVAGSVISVFESTEGFTVKDLDNKWFDIAYGSWVNVTDGADKNDFMVSADKDNKFAPAEKYLADLKSLKVSLTVFDGLAYNIYVPTPVLQDYTMSFLGFFDAAGNQILANVYNGVTVDGTEGWNQLVGLFASDEFTAQTITVKYSVNGQEVSCDVTIDIFNYAYKIDTVYGCGSAESKLVYAMMKYKYEAFKNSVDDDELEADVDSEMNKYYSFHGEDCKCGEVEDTEPTVTADDSNISALVAKYSFALVLDEENNFASKYVFSLFLTEEKAVKINGNTVTGVANGEYFEYSLTGVALADLAKNVTIEIDSASGTYSLAKFIKDTDNSFAKALYVLSVNAEEQNA